MFQRNNFVKFNEIFCLAKFANAFTRNKLRRDINLIGIKHRLLNNFVFYFAEKVEATYDNYDVGSRKTNQQNSMTSSVAHTNTVAPKSQHLINLNLDIGSVVEVRNSLIFILFH